MTKIGPKEAALRAQREAAFAEQRKRASAPLAKKPVARHESAQPMKFEEDAGESIVFPSKTAVGKQPGGRMEHPDDARAREIAEVIDPPEQDDEAFKRARIQKVRHLGSEISKITVGARKRAKKSREEAGKKQLSVWIDPELHREVQIAKAEDCVTLEAWVEEALRQELKARQG